MESTTDTEYEEYTPEEHRNHRREQVKYLVLTPLLRKTFLQDLKSLYDKILELYNEEGDKVKDEKYRFEYGLEKTTGNACQKFSEKSNENDKKVNNFHIMIKLGEELQGTKIDESINCLSDEIINADSRCSAYMKSYSLEDLENMIKLMPKVIDFLEHYEPPTIS